MVKIVCSGTTILNYSLVPAGTTSADADVLLLENDEVPDGFFMSWDAYVRSGDTVVLSGTANYRVLTSPAFTYAFALAVSAAAPTAG